MKTLILITIGLTFLVTTSFGQLKQEGVLNGKYKIFQLDNGETKYLKYNKKEENVIIYNLDNTIWKTIKLPLPKGHLLDEIKMISINTFNNDPLLELMYSCVVFEISNEDENPFYDISISRFTLNIINENGENLLKVMDSNNMEIIESNGVKKMFVYKHIGEGFDEQDQTIVFTLPNTK